MPQPPTDAALLRQLQADPAAALPLLLDAYGSLLNALVRRILPNAPRDAEECLSDVLVAAWRSAPQLARQQTNLKAWLIVTARNAAISRYRKLHAHPEAPLPEDFELLAPADAPPTATEAEDLIAELVDALPPPDREIFLRRYYLLQSAREIGAALNLAEHTVNVRLARGRAKLKQRFLARFGKEPYHA